MGPRRELDGQRGAGRVLLLAAVLAAALGLGSGWWMAQPDHSISQFDRLGAEIGCQCGTCPLRPIATCGCGFADTMLAELQELVDVGQEDEAIMATLVARYNESVRIKPSGSGLDLTAWAAPMLLLTVGAVAVGGIIARWARASAGAPAATDSVERAGDAASTAAPGAGDRERLHDLVERELSELED